MTNFSKHSQAHYRYIWIVFIVAIGVTLILLQQEWISSLCYGNGNGNDSSCEPWISHSAATTTARTKTKSIAATPTTESRQPQGGGPLDWRNHPLAEFPRHRPAPSVVILLGPHKTGSTTVQSCMATWMGSSSSSSTINDQFKDWTWPLPNERQQMDANFTIPGKAKGFAPLVYALKGNTRFTQGSMNKSAVIHAYRQTIQQAWNKGKKIVFGSEEMDHIVDEKLNGTEILEAVMSLLPLATSARDDNDEPPQHEDDDDGHDHQGRQQQQQGLKMDEVEVVVTVRLPRIDHLRSIWHQMGGQKSFSDFILKSRDLYILDALRLVHTVSKHHPDMRVTVVDAQGVSHQQAQVGGLCQVIACDVLSVPCANHQFELKDKLKNTRDDKGPMDLSEQALEQMDAILNEYDCGFRDSLLSEGANDNKLRILFPHNLFASCKADQAGMKPFSWVEQKLRNVVLHHQQ